jgi:hypothetical protein
MPGVELVDVEQLCVDFAKTIIPGRPIGTAVPRPRPARYVRIVRTGGPAENRVLDRPLITVTCAGEATGDASDDAAALRGAFLSRSTTMPLVRGVEEVTGPYFDPDPDTGDPRYTFIMRLAVRARRIP